MSKFERRSLHLRAPAKINLGLKILGRRSDGYHELESVFVPLSLADELELEVAPASETQIECDVQSAQPTQLRVDEVPRNSRNLAVRAAQTFLDAARVSARVRLRLRKRIPAAAGLGGGSSDAAAVLRGLSGIFPDAFSGEELARLALGLGADLPFFLDPRCALVTGIGEKIAPLASLPELVLLLANPGEPLATAEVYRAYAASANSLTMSEAGSTMRAVFGLCESAWFRAQNTSQASARNVRDEPTDSRVRNASSRQAKHATQENPSDTAELWATLLRNDLEPAATALCPAIAELREMLAVAGASAVGLSGSGPTVYGIFESLSAAQAAQRRLREGQVRAGSSLQPAALWLEVATTLPAVSGHAFAQGQA